MAKAALRVALLARAGKARDQLRRALADAGATLVAEGDPAELDPVEVTALAPTFVLVGLEPAIESSLERFDSLLDSRDVEVMFDDAEVTNGLDGWDLNRWARHLVGKLIGTDLLPPAPEHYDGDEPVFAPEPGMLQSPAQLMQHAQLKDYTQDTRALADNVPTDDTFSSGMSFNDPDAQALDGDLDEDVAKLAAQLEAFENANPSGSLDGLEALFGHAPEAVVATTPPPASAEPAPVVAEVADIPVDFDFGDLSLLDIDAPLPVTPATPTPASVAPMFLDSGLSLESMDVESVEHRDVQTGGAVVILAGLGGPDAVRQVLSSLPDHFPVPVLLYQHLEVGKYDRLVEQLAKVSRLPVVLAVSESVPRSGCVSVLPAGITLRADNNALRFEAGPLAQLIPTLPASGTVVVFLSGADASLTTLALTLRDAGGLVLAQDPDVCFDPTAALALQRHGAAVYPALGLARQIALRWSL